MRNGTITLLLALLFTSVSAFAQQEEPQLTAEEIEAYTEQSKQMVKYLEGTLNFLGDPNEVASEKDIIINQSYLKLFASDEVQIEDDLDENREIPLSKDVQAYLKDIDFFYKQVEFTYDVNSVEQFVNQNNQIYFKVTANRKLQGITVTGDTVENNQLRYLEINLDPYKQDLKIVSIYTTKPDVKRELRYWWNNLSEPWRNFFSQRVDPLYDTLPLGEVVFFGDSLLVLTHLEDSVRHDSVIVSEGDTLSFVGIDDSRPIVGEIVHLTDTVVFAVPDTFPADVTPIYDRLKKIASWQSLDLSGDSVLTDLSAVSQLSDLQEINLSYTAISDLTPLRNLNKLEKINCSYTPVASLDPLRYASNLVTLDCSHTPVSDVAVVANFKKLKSLDLSYTPVKSVLPLAVLPSLTQLKLSGVKLDDPFELRQLTSLTNLDLSASDWSDLQPLDSLSRLQNLKIDSTRVTDLVPLSKLTALTTLEANNTGITDLSPLEELESLKIIYCDNSGIDEEEAKRFMLVSTQSLVIYNTEKLLAWWNDMPEVYKNIIRSKMTISDPVTTEEMHRVINLTKVDLSGRSEIETISPLVMLHRLEDLNLEGTSVADLSPLSGLTNLQVLNLNNTRVSDLSPLQELNKLKVVRCENTEVADLLPLKNSTGLQTVYCDNSKVERANVLQLQQSLPQCLVVYQTPLLRSWWLDQDAVWEKVFRQHLEMDEEPTREQLQQLVDLRVVSINDNSAVHDLNPLHLFVRLRELNVNKTLVSDISPVTVLGSLRVLNLSNNPISDLTTIDQLTQLEELNLENTSIEDLELVATLTNLRVLNIAGTRVKNLKPIETLTKLEKLFINNTKIKNLKPLAGLYAMKELRCYNTPLKWSKVEQYKREHPTTEVVFY